MNHSLHCIRATGKVLFKLTLLLISCVVSMHGIAQQTITGRVKDEKGEGVSNSVIAIKGTKQYTSADEQGRFTMKASLPATLVVTAVGYQSAEKQITKELLEKERLEFVLQKETALLNEVVVVGYATKRKSTSASVSTAFAGRAAGISVTPSSPGATIRLRGAVTSSAAPSLDGSFERNRGLKKSSTSLPEKEEDAEKESSDTTDDLPPTSKQRRTSLLTAGEVNDFKKWTMWEDYNAADFKSYSQQWSLYPTKRYCVQLQNKQGIAIIGEQVKLINKATNTTIWTAVTDNTGKAELWAGLNGTSTDASLEIAVGPQQKRFAAIPFENGITKIELNKACNISNDIQIAFVVDATGSMGDEIDYLKAELGDILGKFEQRNNSLALQTGAVFYRDHGDAYVTKLQPFSDSIDHTTRFIAGQAADGGGDYPEAVDVALEQAIDQLAWNATARTKLLFLLMDAPPHDAASSKMAALITTAAAKGIRIVPIACSGTDKATEFIMRSMALATNGTYLFLTDDSGIGDAHIKPTTDEFKVELLNDLLLRTMEQMCFANACDQQEQQPAPIKPFSNPVKLTLYPNPTKGPVTISSNVAFRELYVTDFTGKILMRISTASLKGQYQFNLANFPSATYLVNYITNEGKTGAAKVVLVR